MPAAIMALLNYLLWGYLGVDTVAGLTSGKSLTSRGVDALLGEGPDLQKEASLLSALQSVEERKAKASITRDAEREAFYAKLQPDVNSFATLLGMLQNSDVGADYGDTTNDLVAQVSRQVGMTPWDMERKSNPANYGGTSTLLGQGR